MKQEAWMQWIMESGQVVLPKALLQMAQELELFPEQLGSLILAISRTQEGLGMEELAKDRWIQWSLKAGYAKWQGEGSKRGITFMPLWKKLYMAWDTEENGRDKYLPNNNVGFNYGRVLKWLDHERGMPSVTIKEKQVIQEFNLKYGWNTEFILAFLQLAFERGHDKVQLYQPVAKRVYESGANTINDLVTLMNDIDWTHHKVAEIKKCIGQYGGVTNPQKELYQKWRNNWKFSHELILKAAMETIRTNNPSFKYVDAVLNNWKEKGVLSIDDADRSIKDHEQRIKTRKIIKTDTKRISRSDQRDWENI